MECNKDEAIRAKEIAEQKMQKNDFEGARYIALKARNLYPELDNISRLITVCDVHCSSLKKINGAEKDLYGILQIENVADEATIRKQYRKLALVLHPDKNKFPGAEAAFKLIGEANMTLSDKGKRSLYDAKCRQPVKVPVTKPQNRQNHSSYVKKQFVSQSKVNDAHSSQFNGVKHRQQPPSEPFTRPSFWTYCPFCNIKYEYYREYVNKPLRCQHCSKLFIAYDIGAGGAVPGQNLGSNRAQPSFSHTEKVKVNIQKNEQAPYHFANQTTNTKTEGGEAGGSSRSVHKENGKEGLTKSKGNNVQKPVKTEPVKDTKKKRGRKEASESSSDVGENGGFSVNDNNVNNRKSSRQKQQVSYNEDESPQKRSKVNNNNSPNDVEDVKKENEKISGNAGVDKEADGSMPPGKNDDDSESDSEPEFVDCPDLEFSNFDKDKEENCFAVDQMWACYDSVDGMPRFYARIRKVFTREFKLKITWLEADPDNESEIKWAEEGLPVGCGKFSGGETEETKDRLMFSHRVIFKNGSKRNSFVIYPQKGEIWALFKDWDINWGSNPENHKKFKFDIVEILDVNDNGSVSVALLVKVKGFVSLFQRTVWGGLADRKIPGNEIYRFSHRIPSFKLTGTERTGVPPGSFELDTASLPDDLEKYYYSVKVNLESENVDQKSNLNTPKKNVTEGKNGINKDMVNLRRSPRGLKNDVKENPNDATSSKDEKAIRDFSLDRKIWKFYVGQIWAIWENNNGIIHQCYVKIVKMETNPFRLQVYNLKPIGIQSNVCGLFKLTTGKTKTLPPDDFSHVVKAEESGENLSIYPKAQQIWGLKKRQDSGECEIVEVLESDESGIKVMSLSRVSGYKSVFKGPRVQRSSDNIVVVPRVELNRFCRHIPAFLFTEEKDGGLRGCWELDPVALTGLPLVGAN